MDAKLPIDYFSLTPPKKHAALPKMDWISKDQASFLAGWTGSGSNPRPSRPTRTLSFLGLLLLVRIFTLLRTGVRCHVYTFVSHKKFLLEFT
jgi:hypothetical protein